MPPERTSGPPSWLLPCGLALLAAAVRSVRCARAPVMMNDGPEFIRLAQQIAAGDWASVLGHGFHPLYPLALRLAEPLTGDWERAGLAVSIAAGAAAVVALYWLVAAAFDRRTGAVAAFLLAVHPIAIDQTDVQSDPLYTALFVASAAALWRAFARPSPPLAALAGLLAGAAYLARPEGLGTVVVGIALAALALARREWDFARALRIAAALCLGAALTAGPLVAYLSAQTGSLTLTEKKSVASVLSGGSLAGRRSRPLDPLLVARPDLTPPPRGASPFRQAPPTKGVSSAVARLVEALPKALRPEILVLLAAGLFALRGRWETRGRFFAAYTVLYLVVLLGLSASAGYVSRRHLLPPAVLLFGYAGTGALWLASLARARERAVLAALLVAVTALGLGKALRAERGGAVAERRAAEWLRTQALLRPDDAVAAVKQRVAWYAGAPFVDLRRMPHEALLLPYLRRERARYAIVDEDERAVLEALVSGEAGAARLVHSEQDDGDEAFVYEIAP